MRRMPRRPRRSRRRPRPRRLAVVVRLGRPRSRSRRCRRSRRLRRPARARARAQARRPAQARAQARRRFWLDDRLGHFVRNGLDRRLDVGRLLGGFGLLGGDRSGVASTSGSGVVEESGTPSGRSVMRSSSLQARGAGRQSGAAARAPVYPSHAAALERAPRFAGNAVTRRGPPARAGRRGPPPSSRARRTR